MIGNDCIDLSLKNIWKTWFVFKKGKNWSAELHDFKFQLEPNLFKLFRDLNNGTYRHGGYRKFVVCDNKRREISVASVRDRLVHRLLYDFLVKIYDKTFIYDAWSCRVGKGLLGAIERTHTVESQNSWIWKCDIRKFFDTVDQEILLKILSRRIKDTTSFNLLKEVIFSYRTLPGRDLGMPIGNLTSQIFANIYLNELDRFIKHELKVKAYVRYGDDFVVFARDFRRLKFIRNEVVLFLENELKLNINPKSDKIIKSTHGLKFSGITLWPNGRTLSRRNLKRIKRRLNMRNISSYHGLIVKHGNCKKLKYFNWTLIENSFQPNCIKKQYNCIILIQKN